MLRVAAFRSIETRLPQMRVTANGVSAVIDATGTVRYQHIGEIRADQLPLILGKLKEAGQ